MVLFVVPSKNGRLFYFAFRYTQYNMEENTMNKSFKKILSIVLSVMMISSLMTVSLSVSAVEDGKQQILLKQKRESSFSCAK